MNYKVKMCLRSIGISILILGSLSTCEESKSINEVEVRNEILKLHELGREYHFKKMAEEFASHLSPNHISVNRGEIKMPSREEHLIRINNYFNSVEFEKWDDISPPIIKFSDDYSLAYTIVDKEVIVTYEDENGDIVKDSTKYSWVAIYKKYNGKWKVDCVASTNKPSEIIN